MKKKHHIELIDMSVMHRIFGNNIIAMHEYIENFIKITTELVKKIERAVQQKNSKLTHEYFHQLKGPVGSIGFKKMYKLCEKVEEKIAQSNWKSAAILCLDIEKQLHKLEGEVKKEFQE